MPGLQKNNEENADVTCQLITPSRTVTELSEDIRSGLLEKPRSLFPKYFYDERGSQLFDQICDTPEYYPTRFEDELLAQNANSIISETLPALIIELGSGASRKTRRLFDACAYLGHESDYAPFDVCEPMLNIAARELSSEYDWLDVNPMLGDYHAGLINLPTNNDTNLFVFLGSTIGNFNLEETLDFISDLRNSMSVGDYFLIGADRVKNIDVLNAAYNDKQGLTAEFNLNVLRVLNREVGSNFDLNKFEHLAYYNTSKGQIEMYLVSLEVQEIRFDALDAAIKLEQGEQILTEISRKFEADELEVLLTDNDFELVQHYQPENAWFSLLLVRAT